MVKLGEFPPYGNFVPKIITDVDGRFPVVVYESTATSMKVAVLQVEGPIVNGWLLFPTEPHADDGLPHTLEHLVFMGSEKYPAKGVLDLLANRCLASGTNAWTATDSTTYTVRTAGSEGFCNILPIYLDHVLYPTLTDTAYVTEVHHVTGEGKDGGVIYSEIQTSENTCSTKTYYRAMKLLYPNSGYEFNQGGTMKSLRDDTDNEKVKAYHKKYYRPENLTIIVSGMVDPLLILKAIEPFEQKVIKKGRSTELYVRPWSEPLEPLVESVDEEVLYPSDELTHGLVEIGFRGPPVMDLKKAEEIDVLFSYLADTVISPLQKAFVEIKEPLASRVSTYQAENSVTALFLSFHDVPVDKMGLIGEKLWSVLREVTEETLDMTRIKTIIKKKVLDTWKTLESSPHDGLGEDMMLYSLYGDSAEDLTFMLNSEKYMQALMGKDASFWIKLLREYLDESRPHVILRARPSKELKAELAAEEKKRIDERIQALGPDGLKEMKEIVDHAVEENEKEPDEDLATSVPIPSMENLNFHSIKLYSNFVLYANNPVDSKSPHFNLNSIPVRMRVDDVKSNFVRMRMALDTTNLDPESRLYLLLFLEAIGESTIRLPPGLKWHGVSTSGDAAVKTDSDGWQLVPHEIVVTQIEADTEAVGAHLGLGRGGAFSAGVFANYVMFYAMVELDKYEEGIRWMRDLLFYTHFQPERVQVIASKMAQSVADKKQKGGKIVKALLNDMQYVKGSNPWAVSLVRQQNLLQEASQKLTEAIPSQEAENLPVMAHLKKIQRHFVENAVDIMLYMATNLDRLYEKRGNTALEQPWLDIMLPHFLQHNINVEPLNLNVPPKLVSDASLLSRSQIRMTAGSSEPDPRDGCVVGMGSVESAYVLQSVATDIQSWLHPDYPAVLLFIEYLIQAEGPLWKAVRGQGLSYHYSLGLSPSDGVLTIHLGMAAQLLDAFRVAKEIVNEHIADDSEWDEDLFESAKCSLMFSLVSREESLTDLIGMSIMSSFKGVPVDYTRTLMDRIWKLEEEEVIAAGKKHIPAVFDPVKSKCAVVCHSDKLEEVVEGFKKFGKSLFPFESVEASFLSES